MAFFNNKKEVSNAEKLLAMLAVSTLVTGSAHVFAADLEDDMDTLNKNLGLSKNRMMPPPLKMR